MRYPFLKYTDDMPSADTGGYARFFFIRIRPKYKDDKGIHAHELTHVKQWAVFFAAGLAVALAHYAVHSNWFLAACIVTIGASVHGVYYRFIEPYRLHCEVDAYRVQAEQYTDDRRALFGGYLAKYYRLDITQEQAELMLRS